MRILNKAVKDHIPELMAAYKRERHSDSRFDDAQDMEREIREIMQKIQQELEQKLGSFDLYSVLEALAKQSQRISTKEWQRIVRETLGVDIFDDYYSGEFYEMAIRKWIEENVQKIRTIPNQTLDEMREILNEGFRQGSSIRDISKKIQEAYNMSKHNAELLARDQIASLNAQITKYQQTDAGVSKYKWSTSHDARVRDCHKALNGKIFDWNDPPEMWYDTKSKGRVYTGRRCHPGEDYCCRCVAIPQFDLETIDLPMKGKATKENLYGNKGKD